MTKVRLKNLADYDLDRGFYDGQILEGNLYDCGSFYFNSYYLNKTKYDIVEETQDQHYDNEHGSLYLFAERHGLNAYEFDIIKRITRCRKKGQFKDDLEKTKRVIDLYLKEFVIRENI